MNNQIAEALDALSGLIDYAERQICTHESTHRGGAIWTICDDCGQRWADDRGGFTKEREPREITRARTALAKARYSQAGNY